MRHQPGPCVGCNDAEIRRQWEARSRAEPSPVPALTPEVSAFVNSRGDRIRQVYADAMQAGAQWPTVIAFGQADGGVVAISGQQGVVTIESYLRESPALHWARQFVQLRPGDPNTIKVLVFYGGKVYRTGVSRQP